MLRAACLRMRPAIPPCAHSCGLSQIEQQCRDARGGTFWQDFVWNLRYGFRQLFRAPGFSALCILCLTLGIGANTAVFSWVEGILFRPYPVVAHQDRLFALAGTEKGQSRWGRGPARAGHFPRPPLNGCRRAVRRGCSPRADEISQQATLQRESARSADLRIRVGSYVSGRIHGLPVACMACRSYRSSPRAAPVIVS
jgi:hypothetical protein